MSLTVLITLRLLLPLPATLHLPKRRTHKAAAPGTFLLLVMLIGFMERKDGQQHEFTRCGIHTGSTLLLELQRFSNKKKRGWRKKNTSKYTSFHFISDELFFAWEMDERWLQEAARSDTFHQASLRGPAMHLIYLFFLNVFHASEM